MKPADDKSFPAGVVATAEGLPRLGLLPEETPVLVAEPVAWEAEVRCFVLEREVATFAPYLRDGELARDAEGRWSPPSPADAEALAYARAVLAHPAVPLPPAVVVDVGRVGGRGWAVIEANAAWGSGLYGCDPERVLQVVRRACRPRGVLAEEDLPWLVERAATRLEGA